MVTPGSCPIDGLLLGIKGGELMIGMIFDDITRNGASLWTAFWANFNEHIRRHIFPPACCGD